MRLLVVEDDPAIAGPLRSGLQRENFEVVLARTGAEALAADEVDCVLLDLGLPDIDGRDVCRKLRERSAVPIIMVTARDSEIDKVVGLEIGADDYVTKPYSPRELVARIRAVLRRATAASATRQPDPTIAVGPLTIDTRTRSVTWEGAGVSLTPKEHDLLVYLARDPGAVIARDQLMEEVWNEHWWGSTKTLDVHIASLRKKLAPELVETVRGVGFRLVDLSQP
jgi:two-component system response regulator RegX3